MWINEPMPVITSTITDDKVSRRKARSIVKSPEEIQVNTVWEIARLSAGMPESVQTCIAAMRNDATMTAQASPPDTALDKRRPIAALTTKPASGRKGISASTVSPLQRGKGFGIERFAVPEQSDDQRQPHSCFGRRNGHHEKRNDLSVRAAELSAEGDKRQVHRVQHDLDSQQPRDQVAPQEHTRRSDGEAQ